MSVHGLPRAFFARPAEELAPLLIGCRLVRITESGVRLSGRIVETEAYTGVEDRACHGFAARRTQRNEAMYARPGTAYVYFTYGMHHCFNIVCGEEGEPAAVLVRALEPLEGLPAMTRARTRRRPGSRIRETDLCSGPARLCEALRIDLALNGQDLARSGRIWVEPPARPGDAAGGPGLMRGPRIGVDYAGEWAAAPLRWWERGCPHVSRGRQSGIAVVPSPRADTIACRSTEPTPARAHRNKRS